MTPEEALVAHLGSHDGFTALVANRLYPLVLPQGPTYPAVTYARISRKGRRTLGGTVALVNSRFQFSCWAKSYREAKAVAAELESALQSYSGQMGGAGGVRVLDGEIDNEQDQYEPESAPGIYHVPVDVLLMHEGG